MRCLSGESALFARIVPEGLLKLSPEGGRKFSVVPKLPNDLRHLALRGLHLADKKVDIVIEEDRSYVVFAEDSAVAAGVCGSRLEFAV